MSDLILVHDFNLQVDGGNIEPVVTDGRNLIISAHTRMYIDIEEDLETMTYATDPIEN